MVNLILCGGSGTRLWPLSRQAFPKQFVNLIDDKSLYQETIKRNSEFCDHFDIVTNKEHQFLAEHQFSELLLSEKKISYILEPIGRNTAPAIALSCFNYEYDDVILVTPSDHIINDLEAYKNRVDIAIKSALKDNLVTFGIKPDSPETGYGYIEINQLDNTNTDSIYNVKSFKEKPDRATAERYIETGKFFWNSGMFVFKAGVYLDELKKYSPEIYEKSYDAYKKSLVEHSQSGARISGILYEMMLAIPSDSIDYAVMEKSTKVKVVVSDIGWNDLGSFDSLDMVTRKDKNGNSLNQNLLTVDSSNNLIFSDKRKLALIGVEDMIVVDTNDAMCLIKKGHSQDVKAIVSELQNGNLDEKLMTSYHSTVHRPWGTYTILESSDSYKIKKIIVSPGKRLSLQKHLHRSEHWVVVKGTAIVQIGMDEKIIRKNESIYIPIGEIHRLTNNGKVELVIIETQVGEYLGEDDIIRVEDDFKRG